MITPGILGEKSIFLFSFKKVIPNIQMMAGAGRASATMQSI